LAVRLRVERSAPGVSISSTFAADSRGSVTLALAYTPSGARVSPTAAACQSLAGLPGMNWLGSALRLLSTTYLACNSLPNELHHDVVFERFCQKSESSGIECAPAHWRIVSSANENDPCFGRISAEASLHFQTIHLRHPYIEDRYATRGMVEPGEKGERVAKLFCNKTGRIH